MPKVSERIALLKQVANHVMQGRLFLEHNIGDPELTKDIIELDKVIIRDIMEDLHEAGITLYDDYAKDLLAS